MNLLENVDLRGKSGSLWKIKKLSCILQKMNKEIMYKVWWYLNVMKNVNFTIPNTQSALNNVDIVQGFFWLKRF